MNTGFVINTPTSIMKAALLVAKLVSLYSYAIIGRVLLSWFGNSRMYDQYGRPVNQRRPVYDFLCRITDPYMNFFKSRKLVLAGRIDYSPLFALMVLSILKSLFQILGTYGRISIAIVLAVVVQNLWSYLFSYIFFMLVILLGIRWFAGRKPYDVRSRNIVMQLDRILQKPVNFVFRLFYSRKTVPEQTLAGTAFFFYLVIYLCAKYGFNRLVNLLLH